MIYQAMYDVITLHFRPPQHTPPGSIIFAGILARDLDAGGNALMDLECFDGTEEVRSYMTTTHVRDLCTAPRKYRHFLWIVLWLYHESLFYLCIIHLPILVRDISVAPGEIKYLFCLTPEILLTHRGLVTPYGDIDLCPHWLR